MKSKTSKKKRSVLSSQKIKKKKPRQAILKYSSIAVVSITFLLTLSFLFNQASIGLNEFGKYIEKQGKLQRVFLTADKPIIIQSKTQITDQQKKTIYKDVQNRLKKGQVISEIVQNVYESHKNLEKVNLVIEPHSIRLLLTFKNLFAYTQLSKKKAFFISQNGSVYPAQWDEEKFGSLVEYQGLLDSDHKKRDFKDHNLSLNENEKLRIKKFLKLHLLLLENQIVPLTISFQRYRGYSFVHSQNQDQIFLGHFPEIENMSTVFAGFLHKLKKIYAQKKDRGDIRYRIELDYPEKAFVKEL